MPSSSTATTTTTRVREELRTIGARAPGSSLPLLLFHDVSWPHARRDAYYAPERIPEAQRQPITENGEIVPGEPGLRRGGLLYHWVATREGGPGNGVLTAIEDFVAEREGLRLAVVPAFFGFGVVWHLDAPWAAEVARVVDPWDGHPLVARMEENRVHHLATMHVEMTLAQAAKEREARQDELLWKLLESKSFALAERLSRLRRRRPGLTRADVRRALESEEPPAPGDHPGG